VPIEVMRRIVEMHDALPPLALQQASVEKKE
jgi:hypothetical protein